MGETTSNSGRRTGADQHGDGAKEGLDRSTTTAEATTNQQYTVGITEIFEVMEETMERTRTEERADEKARASDLFETQPF